MRLDPTRYQLGWGIGCFGNWGAADELPQFVHSKLDHKVRGLNRLIAQYQDDTDGMVALIETLTGQLQALEDAGQSVLQLRSLDTGFGQSLDQLGQFLLLQRGGIADNTYRIRLAARAIAAGSLGTPEVVRGVLDFLMCGLQSVVLLEEPPAVTVLRTAELPQIDGDAFARIVALVAPAGTRIIVQWELPASEGPSFGFESDNSAGPWAEWGEDPSDAGVWAEGYDGRDLP